MQCIAMSTLFSALFSCGIVLRHENYLASTIYEVAFAYKTYVISDIICSHITMHCLHILCDLGSLVYARQIHEEEIHAEFSETVDSKNYYFNRKNSGTIVIVWISCSIQGLIACVPVVRPGGGGRSSYSPS